jgi:hypothetical protein
MDAVLNQFMKIPVVFRSQTTPANCRTNILTTIRQGHVTDATVRRFLHVKTGTEENPHYLTCRSTSQLETFHRYVRAFAHGLMSKDTMLALLRRFIFEWNLARARERTNTTGIGNALMLV